MNGAAARKPPHELRNIASGNACGTLGKRFMILPCGIKQAVLCAFAPLCETGFKVPVKFMEYRGALLFAEVAGGHAGEFFNDF